MSILIDFQTVAAIVCIALALICIVYYFIREKVRECRKRRARRLLSAEIETYEKQIARLERYGEIVEDMRRREAILCPTLLKEIVDMLPDPNKLTGREDGPILQGRSVKLVIAGRIAEFQLKFIADRDDAPTGEKGLTIQIQPTGQEVRFTLKLQNRKQCIQGVDVQVNSYFWDLRFSGILLISNEGFRRMIDFILSSRVVKDAFGLNGAKCIGEL